MNIARAFILASTGFSLTSCSAPYIAVEAYEDNGEIWFRDASANIFVTDCVDAIEVTDDATGELVWDASAKGPECLAHLPFKYGTSEAVPDPDRHVAAAPLKPGREYSIFVHITGGAGDGNFRIEPNGQVTKLD